MHSLYPADAKLHPSKVTKVISNTATIIQPLQHYEQIDPILTVIYIPKENIDHVSRNLAIAHVRLGNISVNKSDA